MAPRLCILIFLLISQLLVAQDEGEIKLTILFTSDLHGAIRGYDYFNARETAGGLAAVDSYVQELRKNTDHLLILDGGDTISGLPNLCYSAEAERELPSPIIAAMNTIGYQAMAVGNHEFDYGLHYTQQRQAEAEFPWLSANIINRETGEPAFKPYEIVTISGLKAGVLGFTTHLVPTWLLHEKLGDLEFIDPRQVAQQWVNTLRNDENCDLVIILIHSGFERSKEKVWNVETPGENVAYQLAESLIGVDVLLAGHSHAGLGPWMFGETIAANCPAHARGAVEIELAIQSSPEGMKISKSGKLVIFTEENAKSERILRLSEENHRKTEAMLEQPVCELTEALAAPRARLYDNRLVDILNRAQMEAVHADISFISLLPWRGIELEAGTLRVRDVFRLVPFENEVVGLEVTGAQVKAYLEHSARFYDGIDPLEDGRFAVTLDRAISPWNVEFAEGVSYRVDPAQPEGSRVMELCVNGQPMAMDAIHRVAVNSYRRNGGGGFDMLTGSRVYYRSRENFRRIVINFFASGRYRKVQNNNNWFVAPALVPDKASYLY